MRKFVLFSFAMLGIVVAVAFMLRAVAPPDEKEQSITSTIEAWDNMHPVGPGETYGSIADAYGVDEEKLKSHNLNRTLKEGSVVEIPPVAETDPTSTLVPSPTSPGKDPDFPAIVLDTSYVGEQLFQIQMTESGVTLQAIADNYGVSATAIVENNVFMDGEIDNIPAGKLLVIPFLARTDGEML